MQKLVVAVAMLGACVHQPALNATEECATNGMVLTGIGLSEEHSSGGIFGGGINVVSRGASYGQSASCRRPATEAEVCEVRGAEESLRRKQDFGTGVRNLFVGAFYVAAVLPGLFFLWVFDHDSDDAGAIAALAGQRVRDDCLAAGAQTSEVAQPSTGWWCTWRPSDELGTCSRSPGKCELARLNANTAGGSAEQFGACAERPAAICAQSGCYTTPAGCAKYERMDGRDGTTCVVRH